MKRLITFTALIYFAGTGLVLALNKPILSAATPARPTPVILAPMKGLAISPTHTAIQYSNIHAVNLHMREQKLQLVKDLKAGKITKEQAKAAMLNIKAVRKQTFEFFRQNGRKDITADQKSQLEKMLAGNAGSL